MQPIDIAEKWTKAALALWDNSHTSDQTVVRLAVRVRAHYGNYKPALSEVVAVAMVEAMNEWQHVRDNVPCDDCEHVQCAQSRQNS